jgi:soluble lytic murein transglycosylase-like protein
MRRPRGMEQYALEEMMNNRRGMGRMSSIRSRLSGLKAGDMDMAARNSSLGRKVPGLGNVRFAPDLASGMATAVKSQALWNKDKMSHPAVGFSRGQAGIDGIAQSEIARITGETESALAGKGIARDAQGNWGLTGTQRGPGASVPSTGVAGPKRTGITGTSINANDRMGLPQSGTAATTQTDASSSANGGTVRMGNVPANTKLNIDVSGGTQIANGQRTTGTPGKQSVGQVGGSPASGLAQSIQNTVMGKTGQIGQIGGSGRSSSSLGGLADTIRNAVNQQVQTPSDGVFSAGRQGPVSQAPGGGIPRPPMPPGGGTATQPVQQTRPAPTAPAMSQEAQGGTSSSGLPIMQGGEPIAVPPGQSNLNKPNPQPASSSGNPPVFAPVAVGDQQPAQPIPQTAGYMAPGSKLGQMAQGQTVAPSGGGMGQPIASTPPEYAPLVQQAADKHGVPANILSAMLQSESNWDPNAVSPAGAQGLGQFMPGTAEGMGINPFDPAQAIDGAAAYLKQQKDTFGSWELALAAYNAGPGAVEQYGGIPPFEETQAYVPKIMGLAGPVDSTSPAMGITPQGTTGGATGIPDPQGVVQSQLLEPNATGLNWDSVNQYDAEIAAAVAKYPEVDPAMVKAAIAMESQGDMYAANPYSSSYGVLQIQPEWHRANAEAMGLQLSDETIGFSNPADDIMYWTALMAGKVPGNVPPGNTPIERYYNNYGTGDAYFQDINSLMGEINAAAPAQQPQQTQQTPQGPYPKPGIGDVGPLGVEIIQGPQRLAGSPVSGQAPAPGQVPGSQVPGSASSQQVPVPPGGVPQPRQLPVMQGGEPLYPGGGLGNKGGMMVGADAVGNQPPPGGGINQNMVPGSGSSTQVPVPPGGVPDLNQQMAAMDSGVTPGGVLGGNSGAKIGSQVIDPNTGELIPGPQATGQNRAMDTSGMNLDPIPTQPGAPTAAAAPTPPPSPDTVRPPRVTGVITPLTTPSGEMTGITANGVVQQGDGLGIYAGPDADESWIGNINPGAQVSTDYKQNVCSYNPDCCNGGPDCWYNSNLNLGGSASNTVHPGYDVAIPAGETFAAPIEAEVIGTVLKDPWTGAIIGGNQSDPRCSSPGGTNECTWASDGGIVLGGITDVNGNPIYINMDHTYADDSLVGTIATPGTVLGTINQENHTHVEIHGYDPITGQMVVLDPSLVFGGYYNTHSVSEGISAPVSQSGQASGGGSGYMNPNSQLGQQYSQQVPASQATYTTDSQSYSQQPAPQQQQSLPPPSYYNNGAVQQTTGQVVTDTAGRQYEVMADGTQRLIYDPSW